MPYSVEGFADVTEDSSDFKAIIKSFTNAIVDIDKLICSRIARDESGLQGLNNAIVVKEVKDVFVDYFLHYLTKNT